jgi:hypothetical protein
MKVVFLDIDGVLNAHEDLHPDVMCGQIHSNKVAYLNQILERTGAKLVLSSAWRYLIHRKEMDLVGLGWLLRSHGIYQDRLIGITRPDTMVDIADSDKIPIPLMDERGEQISDWLKEHPECERYVVLDDLDLGISEAKHPFVLVDGSVGLTEQNVEAAISILQEK